MSHPEDADREYNFRILIKHPIMDPEIISAELALVPSGMSKSGDPVRTPQGIIVGSGVYNHSSWGKSWHVGGKRYFFESIPSIMEKLEGKKLFINDLNETGGSVELIFHLDGASYIGDTISWELLARMGKLKINMGVEVFPEFS